MKRWYITILVVMALAAGVILSCSKTTIIDMREDPEEEVYIPRTKADSTETEDTSRIPISFDVSVEGWKEVERE